MSASIRLSGKIHALIAIDNVLLPNSYDLSYTLSMATNNIYEQNVVIERIRFFMDTLMANTIMVENKNPVKEVIEKSFGNKYALFDSVPYDTTLCNVIYLKSSSILQEHATIEALSLSSTQGQDIDYYAEAEDDYTSYRRCSWLPKNRKPWWLRDDLSVNDIEEDKLDWTDVGLGWKEVKEDTETTIIQFPKFMPKIIQGGPNVS